VYFYDRHVPMIFMGPGITAGRDPSHAATVDFAPTYAKMLGIPFPNDLDGRPLTAISGR
jgi:arylsulfatase A-like enzyme